MKKLLLTLAGIVLAGNAFAAEDTTWKHAGEMRVRYLNQMNKGLKKSSELKQADNAVGWEQRTWVGLTASKGESVTAHVKLLAAGAWGRDISGGETSETIKMANEKNTFGMLEGYIWWKSSDMMSWKFGRGGMTIADGTVVSFNNYEQIPRVFDGVLGSFDFGFATVNVFGVKGAELGAGALTTDAESNFYGVSADFKNLPDALKMANLHVIQDNQDVLASTDGHSYMRIGLTLGGDMSGFDYRATYAMQNGTQRDTTLNKDADVKKSASMLDVGAGYTLAEMMNTRIGVIYHMDSGNKGDDAKKNNTYEPFHYDKHNNAGLMDYVSWGNLSYLAVTASLQPADGTTVGLNYFMFTRTQKEQAFTVGKTGSTVTGTGDSTAIGSEIDLFANKDYGNGFNIGLRYSMFTAGEHIKKALSDKSDNASQLWLQASLGF